MNLTVDPREVRIVVADDNRDAADALAAIDRFRPNVAILDVVMPELDGIEIADRVR